ncbi:MAG: peptidase [Bacteroidia bacterium]
MKRWKLINIIINYIYHDNIYLMSPFIDWDLMNMLDNHFKDNYQKVRPVLLIWQEKGYITLVEDNEVLFIFHPEKLPTKQDLTNLSNNI